MNTSANPLIIGLAGTFASGKDTLAKHLGEKYGYIHISTSDMVRKEAQARYGSIERPVLFQTATEVRHSEGPGAFAKRGIEEAAGQPVIISGLRSTGERDMIVEHGGIIVFVDAPVEVRYERMKARQRDAETQLSLIDFAANEQKEWHGGNDPADFNLRQLKDDAQVVLENVLPLDEFLKDADTKIGLQA